MTVPVLRDGTDPVIPHNYLDKIAERIYWLCEPNEMYINDRELYRIYAVLCLAKGTEVTIEDVHHAWAAWTAGLRPQHKSLVPFNELTKEVQELDRKYMEAIHVVAKNLQ